MSGSPKYLACYELENVEVRDTPEYTVHRDQPTEWTKRLNLQGIRYSHDLQQTTGKSFR